MGAMAGTAGTMAAPVAGAMANAGIAGAAAEAPTRMDLGKGDGTDVVTIGDSYMQLGNEGIEPSLDKAAENKFRHYARMGTQLTNGQIPMQYDRAKMENAKISTVLMTGGGNDFLQVPMNSL